MPDPKTTAEYQHAMKADQAVYDWALSRGVDPEPLLQGLHDLMTVTDLLDLLDLGEVMQMEYEPVTPTIGHISETRCLFYRGKTHAVWGQPSAGKSMVMQFFAVDEMKRGNRVMWIDTEEPTAQTINERFHDLELTAEEAAGNRMVLLNRKLSPENAKMLANIVFNEDVKLVVLDSLGEFLALCGRDENKDLDVTWAHEFLLRPLAAAGAAVVVIDHPSRSTRWYPAGSKRKLAALTGAGYTMNADCKNEADDAERSFSRDKAGYSNLFCVKDRHGHFPNFTGISRFNVEPGRRYFGEYEEMSDIEDMIGGPENRQLVAESAEAKVLAYVSDGGAVTSRLVKEICGLANQKQADELLQRLASEGKLAYSKTFKSYGIPVS